MTSPNPLFKGRTFGVSDHALVRWLERVHQIDVEFYREALAKEIQHRHATGMKLLTLDGMTYVFGNDNIMKTMYPVALRKQKRITRHEQRA